MPTKGDAQTLAQKLHALAGGPEVTRKAAARAIGRLEPWDATELISHLLVLSAGGDDEARCALSALGSALQFEAADIPHAGSLRRLASLQDLAEVAALFPEGPPIKELDPKAAAKADALKFSEPLGQLKTKARLTRNPDELARLATASSAQVVRNVLLNPRLTEALVVRIAARRPARPEPLVEIWRSARWGSRHAIRRALVFNPYFPPEVGAKIVPLLTAQDWRELAHAAGVHASLRDQARLLLTQVP